MSELTYYRRPKLIDRFEDLLDELVDAEIQMLTLAHEMGDVSLFERTDAIRARKALDERGIVAPAMHGVFRGIYDLNQPDRRQVVEAHTLVMAHGAAMGAKTYVMHAGLPVAGRSQSEEWDAVTFALDALIPLAEELGLVLALENLPPTYVGHRPDELLAVIDRFDSPHLRLCFDSGHANMCGDPAAFLEAVSRAVITMHLHDNDGTADRHDSPGHGNIDWSALSAAIDRCPNAMHLEVESFNREGYGHAELMSLYRNRLKG